jgi:hypothetical protein
MVYQQKLVAVIKHNGKILREVDNTVYLPFLAEYEVFIKNLESRDVVVNISIDGQDVLDNQSLIIKANSSFSLEGFLKGNKTTNKFKFIQKTEQIQNHRGDRVDDGLVRIEYRFTKLNQTITTTHHHIHEDHWYHPSWCDCVRCRPYRIQPSIYPYWPTQPIITYGGITSGTTFTTLCGLPTGAIGGSIDSSQEVYSSQVNYRASAGDNVKSVEALNGQLTNSVNSNAFVPQFDEGITVKGSESDQQFVPSHTSPLEDESHTIILKLRGTNKEDKPVEKPVLVKTKVKCSTCGNNYKSHVKYCSNCGTALF